MPSIAHSPLPLIAVILIASAFGTLFIGTEQLSVSKSDFATTETGTGADVPPTDNRIRCNVFLAVATSFVGCLVLGVFSGFSFTIPGTTSTPADFLAAVESGGIPVLSGIASFFNMMIGFINVILQVISFNIPGAPTFIRLVVGGTITSIGTWSIVELIRGT